MDPDSQPPSYSSSAPPPAGTRVPATTSAPFPPAHLTGPAPFIDNSSSHTYPIFVASALMGSKSVQPCKVSPDLQPHARVPYAGVELEHSGRYDILPITDEMVWLPASDGQIPKGRRPVEGGFEESGEYLYHALLTINGQRVPGKTGAHLHAAHVAYGGAEMVQKEGYEVLCWRE